MDTKKIAFNNLIFETITGSHAYGMNTSESDIDYRGIFIAPKENVVTGLFPIEQYQDPDEDRVFYELRKYVKLLVDMNPNILELLWVDERFIVNDTPLYWHLRDMREELLSSKTKFTFSGYAHSQLKRLKGHKKWINNPQPKEAPQQKDYVRPFGEVRHNPCELIEGAYFQNLQGHVYTLTIGNDPTKRMYTNKGEIIIQDGKLKDIEEAACIVTFDRDGYMHDLNQWKGYWEWKSNRNEKRAALEEAYHMDTKHASHLIRLLRMGKEILSDGVVNVWREDADELLAIRNGQYTYDEIIEMSDGLQADVDRLYEVTDLPKKIDPHKVSKMLLEMYEERWK